MHGWGRGLEQRWGSCLGAHPASQGSAGGHAWVLLTWATRRLCTEGRPPLSGHAHDSLEPHATGSLWCATVSPSTCAQEQAEVGYLGTVSSWRSFGSSNFVWSNGMDGPKTLTTSLKFFLHNHKYLPWPKEKRKKRRDGEHYIVFK